MATQANSLESDRLFEHYKKEPEGVIARLGLPWVYCPYGIPTPRCDPCFGAVGPYGASWHNPESDEFRCTGCLLYDLRELEEHAMPEEAVRDHLNRLKQEAVSMRMRIDRLSGYIEEKFSGEKPF